MKQAGKRMNQARVLILALLAFATTACAAGVAGSDPADTGPRPRDNEATRAASLHLLRAGQAEDQDAAMTEYREALADALLAIEQMPENAKGYLIAGQASVGAREWIRADTMFDRALELYPGYDSQIAAEREEGWVAAYNLGADALNSGDQETAREMFEGSVALNRVRPEPLIALGSVQAGAGETEAAAESYAAALEILNAPQPEGISEEDAANWDQNRRAVALTAAQMLAQTGDFRRAADILQAFLDDYEDTLDPETALNTRTSLAGFLAQAGDTEAAEAMYNDLLDREGLTANQYFQAGIGFFNTSQYGRAADAFSRAAEMNPYSRDALLNVVQALYSHSQQLEESEEEVSDAELVDLYDRIIDSGDRVRELDPLNRNVVSFMLRAFRHKAEVVAESEVPGIERRMQDLYRAYESQEYEVTDIRLSMEGDEQTRVTGSLMNLNATAGETVQIRFQLVGDDGRTLGEVTVPVQSPAEGEGVPFTGVLDVPAGDFAGWRYELL